MRKTKVNWGARLRDLYLGQQHGVMQMDVTLRDMNDSFRVRVTGPEQILKIRVVNNYGDFRAEFEGPYCYRSAYRFIMKMQKL